MTTVGGEHVGYKHADELAPGEAQVHRCDWANGVTGPIVVFGCPLGKFPTCAVPAKPSPPNSRGCSWDVTGDAIAPTLSPSVNCDRGCGWHGFIREGRCQ